MPVNKSLGVLSVVKHADDIEVKENEDVALSERKMLERTRELDYVSQRGLLTLTGCSVERLDLFIMKELIDNALDACGEDDKSDNSILVSFDTEKFLKISVKDNGKGLNPEDIMKITDFNKLYSTKHHYKVPKRGSLGNAFKTLMGIPYALAQEKGISYEKAPIKICSKKKEYNISLLIDELKGTVETFTKSFDVGDDDTEIALTLPLMGQYWGYKQSYLDLLSGYAILNPSVGFKIILNPRKDVGRYIEKAYSSIGDMKKKFTGRTSIHWYGKSEFYQLVGTYVRDLQVTGKKLNTRDFIQLFRGLSSYAKSEEILREINVEEEKIHYISDAVKREEIVNRLYDAMKNKSTKPSPAVLSEIGKDNFFDRIKQIYGEPDYIKYSIEKYEYIDHEGVQIPYVLEILVAVMPSYCDIKRKIVVGINNSPCISNPFDRCTFTWVGNRKEQSAYGVRGLIEKYGITKDEPVIVVMHLNSTGVKYINYGKSEIVLEPFKDSLSKNLYSTCKFYYKYKRGISRGIGKKSVARNLLIQELIRRKNIFIESGSIPEDERTTQQGLYYKIRKKMRGETDIERQSLISAIKDECDSLRIKREELGIFAAVRAEMHFRGKVYPVSWANISELAKKGSDIILIEKEGISLALAPYASRKGVALINSRGFIVDYAKDLLALSKEHNANIFQLTDYDASGLVISMKIQGIPRMGVDPITVSELGLRLSDVQESYKAPTNHLKKLPKALRKEVENKRIEIDSILAETGPRILWGYLEKKMFEIAPQRDLSRSLELTVNLPTEILEIYSMVSECLQSIGEPTRTAFDIKLKEWKEGFLDVNLKEKELQDFVTKRIERDVRTQEFTRKFDKLARNLIIKFPKFNLS